MTPIKPLRRALQGQGLLERNRFRGRYLYALAKGRIPRPRPAGDQHVGQCRRYRLYDRPIGDTVAGLPSLCVFSAVIDFARNGNIAGVTWHRVDKTCCCSAFNYDPFDQVKSKSYRANRRPIHTPINKLTLDGSLAFYRLGSCQPERLTHLDTVNSTSSKNALTYQDAS